MKVLHTYDWDNWLDGDAWQIVRGEDFLCTVESMRQQAHGAAARRGQKLRTHRVDDNTIIIQAVPEITGIRRGRQSGVGNWLPGV